MIGNPVLLSMTWKWHKRAIRKLGSTVAFLQSKNEIMISFQSSWKKSFFRFSTWKLERGPVPHAATKWKTRKTIKCFWGIQWAVIVNQLEEQHCPSSIKNLFRCLPKRCHDFHTYSHPKMCYLASKKCIIDLTEHRSPQRVCKRHQRLNGMVCVDRRSLWLFSQYGAIHVYLIIEISIVSEKRSGRHVNIHALYNPSDATENCFRSVSFTYTEVVMRNLFAQDAFSIVRMSPSKPPRKRVVEVLLSTDLECGRLLLRNNTVGRQSVCTRNRNATESYIVELGILLHFPVSTF